MPKTLPPSEVKAQPTEPVTGLAEREEEGIPELSRRTSAR
jgi:hypothetical protein